MDLSSKSHRRYNPLTGEWVLVSPERMKRPWQGKVEVRNTNSKPAYDAGCYLCPGNERAGTKRNPVYNKTYVFENDYSALNIFDERGGLNLQDLIISEDEPGICKVVCFSPRHDLTIADMEISDIRTVIDTWTNEYEELTSREDINYVQIFENKGEIMGCSNSHPHSQIWATHSIPVEPLKETLHQAEYFKTKKNCLLCEYLNLETQLNERIIMENDDFSVLVPFWAVWPFETMILSRRHTSDMTAFTGKEKNSLASILKRITQIYDKVFNVSFPYSAGIHQAPADNKAHPEWHFHYHFYPPLLRSEDIKKFMVGYEMLANPQKDFTAETAAGILKDLAGKFPLQVDE